MSWENPLAFWVLIPFAVLILFLIFFQKKRRAWIQWSSLQQWPAGYFSLRVFFSPIPVILQLIAIFLIILALARPQQMSEIRPRSLEGIDIMMVVDISFSMMVPDMSPGTRLSASQDVLRRFIDGLSSDRVGLILFSGESYTKVPLTLDYDLLKEEINKIETTADIQQGTAIGVALANAVARLRHSTAKSRVIILLTDGENNAGNINPKTAVSLTQHYGIKIYSIGIGSQKKSRIPIKTKDILGREKIIHQIINSQVNKQLLSDVSRQTNGKFYLAKSLKNLEDIFSDIDSLEKSKIESSQFVLRVEKFQDYLNSAFWLIVISLILSLTIFGRII